MQSTTIGVISDTHGLVRPEAKQALAGCDFIIHAGDIGSPEVVTQLEQIAPLHIVRGNVDVLPWADAHPASKTFEINGIKFHLLHNIRELAIDPVSESVDVVVFGHSHKFHNEACDGVLYFNPASAGPRRFSLPAGVGRILIQDGKVEASHIELVRNGL